jgi:hypothetical protein
MHRNIRFIRLILIFVACLCLPLTKAGAEVTAKGIKVQLVLEARNASTTIPYQDADQIVDHLSQEIQETAFTSVLRGDDKIILTFFSPLSCKNEIPAAISSINSLPSRDFIKTSTWKHDEAPLPDEIVFGQNKIQPVENLNKTQATSVPADENLNNKSNHIYRGQTSLRKGRFETNQIEYIFDHDSDDLFSIKAKYVPLEMILDSISAATDLEYICPRTIGQRELSINCKSVSMDSLLSAFKLSLNLSIKRTGKIVIFVDE